MALNKSCDNNYGSLKFFVRHVDDNFTVIKQLISSKEAKDKTSLMEKKCWTFVVDLIVRCVNKITARALSRKKFGNFFPEEETELIFLSVF